MSETGPEPAAERVPPVSAGPRALGPEEFARHFEAAAPRLWAVAAGVLGGRAQAEDVVQEAAVIALQKLDQFHPDTDLMAWLARIVRFVALNRARRRARRGTRAVEHVAFELLPGTPVAEAPPVDARGELTDGDALGDELAGALRELAPTARACLLLRTLLDLDYREIARTLEIPEGTAMSHVHRARRTLRARLSGESAAEGGGA